MHLSPGFRLVLVTALWVALTVSCRDTRRTLGSLRSAVEPPTPPPDTIPEMLDYAADLQVDLSEMAKLPIGLLYTDLTVGTGAEVVAGDSVEVAFQGWMPNGTQIDSADVVVRVGAGDVIAGIDAALPGMKPGGKRKLVLPPGLGYGGEGKANVPPNTVLVYEVELRARIP